MSLAIRSATPADAPVIHGLIRALAEFEREPNAVEVTPARLREQLAAPHPPFECVLAEVDGEAAGMALFFPTYSTWRGAPGLHIEDLIVLEPHRRRGVGRALLGHVARLAAERGYARLEWAVLDWNTPAIRFYEQLGAEPLAEWTTYRLPDAARRRLAAG